MIGVGNTIARLASTARPAALAAVACTLVAATAPSVEAQARTKAQTQTRTQAETQSSNQRLRIDNVTVTVPGSGTYRVNGGIHLLVRSTRDAAGGTHLKLHANPQGLSAISTSGGPRYRITGAANAQANLGAPKGAASEGTAVLNFGLIGQGQAPNLRLHVNLHLTTNANGATTARVTNVRLVRQG